MREPFDQEQGEAAPSEGPGPVRRGLHRRRVRRRRRLLLGAVGAILVLVVAAVTWYELQSHALGGPGREVVLTVHSGESTESVADALASKGVVGSSLALKVYFLVHGSPRMEPGSYALDQNSSFSEVKAVLNATPNLATADVLPGLTVQEVANQLPSSLKKQFEQAVAGGAVTSPFDPPGVTSLEGLLGTGTYQVVPGETGSELLVAMVQRFERQAEEVGLSTAAAAALKATPYDVVTIASVVQKEGYLEKNMGPVARVIYNRLSTGTPLQMDSTVLYSLGQDGGTVTPQDLQDDTPYNTYLHAGLPPTPICFPSEAALKAALNPPAGSWLYFVVVEKDGTEAFSTTYQQQLANEQLARSRGLG